ncbi:glycosyltransferase [Halanaerobacter jeridensis]|uniref:Glycosyltransferase involved in cell wall biosynthesis n=1 Tax=Halanaerobacter jeridensis TaxID=706427 RepID=A0A938XSY7_9FIRM|nr:glycosyltransferase [Halanaerobacter jeridensis]MBM7556945.1 glycosyltransferase involved in cell wall biosynthesis [Halanaerobacter jeridensis]
MKVVLVCNGDIPPEKYGGTQRVVAWLAKGLLHFGHKVYIINDGKCSLEDNNLEIINVKEGINNLRKAGKEKEIFKYLPDDFDIVHFHFNPKEEPDFPYVVTFHWLGKARDSYDETILPNTIFASQKHAEVNGRKEFVYHGLDPDEFLYQKFKEGNYLFLSKVSYPAKNVKTAIKLAKDMKFELDIAGGWRLSLSRYLHYKGMVGGLKKKKLLCNSKALIFPTLCEEPFGLVTIEALVSGTPVITSQNGAMPEIVTEDVGFRCDSYEEYKAAVNNIDQIDADACRQRVLNNFTHVHMAEGYLKKYQNVIDTGTI